MIEGEAAAKAWLGERLGCDRLALDRLERFVALLEIENQQQNLVAARSWGEVWTRHIVDSAQLLAVSSEPHGPWLDLGTGAGFPGLVVAILRPEFEMILVESRSRRCEWLAAAAVALAVNNVTVLPQRLEKIAPFAVKTISARAFAPLDRLLALAAPFSTSDTLWLLPKGRNGSKELDEMPRPNRAMFHVEPSLTEPGSAILVGRGVPAIVPGRTSR